MINPAWMPYFSRAAGFVSEVGGWLSHPAILAREYDVALIVGTAGMTRIADGSLLRLHLDGRIEVLEDREVRLSWPDSDNVVQLESEARQQRRPIR